MGTRNLTCIYKGGKHKVAQYGQWDGYPDGLGLDILRILTKENIKTLSDRIDRCVFISDDDVAEIYESFGAKDGYIGFGDSKRVAKEYPLLHRDNSGDKVIDYILSNDLDAYRLSDRIDFAVDGLYCEWCYVIDLDSRVFEVYRGFSQVEAVGRFADMDKKEYSVGDYYPVTLVYSWGLNDLPSDVDFIKALTDEE